MPLHTNFNERHNDGNRGEVAFARFCAKNVERTRSLFGLEYDEIHIRSRATAVPQKINGISFFFEPSTKADQKVGDLYLTMPGGASPLNIEVKTEEWAYGERFDYGAKVSPNIAFETFSVVSSVAYRKFWQTGGKFNTSLRYSAVTPEYFTRWGGHFVTQAEWLVHCFSNGTVIGLPKSSLEDLRRRLTSAEGDQFQWFSASTGKDQGGRYYTIGKKLPVAPLLAERLAFRL